MTILVYLENDQQVISIFDASQQAILKKTKLSVSIIDGLVKTIFSRKDAEIAKKISFQIN